MFSKDIEIQKIVLLEKRGGKSGIYKRHPIKSKDKF